MKKQLFSLISCIVMATAANAQTNVFFDDFGMPGAFSFTNWESIERDNDQSGSHNTWHSYYPPTGMTDGVASSFAMGTNRDHLFKSRSISLPSGSIHLSYKIATDPADEHYAVYILPAGNTFQGTETPILEETINNTTAVTKNINIPNNLAGQQVRIYFRHFQQGQAFLHLDDVAIKTGAFLSVSESGTPANDKISIYPNPVKNELHIKSPEKILSAEVFDMTGRSMPIQSDISKINVSKLESGNYILKIETREGISIKKMTKE